MISYYVAAALNAGLCLQLYYFPLQGLLPILLPTAVSTLLALWFILGVSPWAPFMDHRGREHDWTFRTLQVVVEGCPPGCTCANIIARRHSIPGIIRVTPTRQPSREFDFCLFLGCRQIAHQHEGALHDLTNIALANRGIALVTFATPWDWRPGLETLWGRVQYIPEQGVMFCLRHPAVHRLVVGGRELRRGVAARFILAHSRQTLSVEDWTLYGNWGVKPPVGTLEIYDFFVLPTRIFAFVFILAAHREYAWSFLLYVPIGLAHVMRFCHYVMYNPMKRTFHRSGSFPQATDEEVDERPNFTRHGHHFAS